MSEYPELNRPILVAAFEGWNDAGDAASGAVEHLELVWDATMVAEIESDDYYDFQVNRPVTKQVDGVVREILWPTITVSVCLPPGSDRHVVLLRGVEPNVRWRAFCAELMELISELNIEAVVLLGALLADTPHTRPVGVTGSAFSAESAQKYGVADGRYEGPAGITGVLHHSCVQAGVRVVSFWAAVPHYVSSPPNPPAVVALLGSVEEVIDVEVPLGSLPEQAREWSTTVDEMTADDEEIAEYVRGLEQRGDEEATMKEAAQRVDGDAIAAEFERYLRRRGGTGA